MRKMLCLELMVFMGCCSVLLSGDPKSYGGGVTGGARTPISDILANPETFEGKVVRIEGRVADVCRKAGCWMDIQDEAGRRIQIKVDDGVIIFPVGAIGNRAVAEGRIEILDMARESYVAWLKHMAKENGREFDDALVGEPPYRIVRIRASGATIDE